MRDGLRRRRVATRLPYATAYGTKSFAVTSFPPDRPRTGHDHMDGKRSIDGPKATNEQIADREDVGATKCFLKSCTRPAVEEVRHPQRGNQAACPLHARRIKALPSQNFPERWSV